MQPSSSPVCMGGLIIDCPDADVLARFYAQLLDWQVLPSEVEWAAAVRSPDGAHIIGFQTVEDYTPPVWPWQQGAQAQMMHLDFSCPDLAEAEAHALRCGATLAPAQFFEEARTMMDPAGHPFCLCPMG